MNNETPEKCNSVWKECCSNVVWWAWLVLAVMIVPLIGGGIALAVTDSPLGQMVVFVLACWTSVWLGMWLVRKADKLHAQIKKE